MSQSSGFRVFNLKITNVSCTSCDYLALLLITVATCERTVVRLYHQEIYRIQTNSLNRPVIIRVKNSFFLFFIGLLLFLSHLIALIYDAKLFIWSKDLSEHCKNTPNKHSVCFPFFSLIICRAMVVLEGASRDHTNHKDKLSCVFSHINSSEAPTGRKPQTHFTAFNLFGFDISTKKATSKTH